MENSFLIADDVTGIPGLELQALFEELLRFLMSSFRLAGLYATAPFFGATSIPVQVRVVATMITSFVIYMNVDIPNVQDIPAAILLGVVGQELLLGVSAGLVLTIIFAAAVLAGEKIAASSGLGFAAQVDPNSGGQTPVISQFLSLFLLVTFLSLNGHLEVIAMIFASYEAIPVGAGFDQSILVSEGIDAGSTLFAVASVIMMPLVVTLLLANIVVGVVTRSAPQLNLFSFGFPLTIMIAFVGLYFSVVPTAFAFRDMVDTMLAPVARILMVN